VLKRIPAQIKAVDGFGDRSSGFGFRLVRVGCFLEG
jgi:hypothetical protein